MENVTAAQVRAAGGWNTTEAPDATLALAPFIPAGDGWLNEILSENGIASLSALTSADADRGALALGAECYYVAHLYASRAPKKDFKSGPVASVNLKAGDILASADHLLKKAKEMIDRAGLVCDKWGASYKAGDDMHPEGDDDTQVDFGLAHTEYDEDWNFLGVEQS